MQGDVYRIAFPRTDLHVSIGNVALRAGFALGSWVAFRASGTEAIVNGDLVLTEREVDPVVSRLFAGGLEITALHNHLVGETPRVMYLHIWGKGEAPRLAEAIGSALAQTGTPRGPAPAPAAGEPGFDADAIQKRLGVTGAVRGGVLSVAVPRRERIVMMGEELPPSMGMATSLNFQAADGTNVAATGDFVLSADQVNAVARALVQHGIGVRALHNHMIHGAPELYFMHFWAVGPAASIADGLKAGLDAMR